MTGTPERNSQTSRRPWPLPLRILIACAVGVMATCIVYWGNWHRQAGNAVFTSLVDFYGWQFRTSQPIAEVVLVSVLCVPGLLVALYAFHRLSRRPTHDGEPRCPECGRAV